jgi:hypothetical protein
MLKLKRNMGATDRAARTLVGITLLTVGPLTNLVPTDMMSNILMGIVATLALGSAALGYCFLYVVTGFDTGGKPE